MSRKKTNQKTKTTINTRCRSTPVIVCRQQDVLYVDYALFLCKHTHTHTPENYMTSVLSRLPLLIIIIIIKYICKALDRSATKKR